jgi:2-polyprenyl-3-methyl-5-hydroxy-6-metoxy-1,4-benzoquinol methylase
VGHENPDFRDYLTRHYAHLGDQAKHREGKKRQLLHTYGHLLPASRDAAMLEIGPGFGQLLEGLRRDRGYANAVAIDLSREVVDFCNGLLPGSTEYAGDTAGWLRANAGRFERIFVLHVLEHVARAEVGDLVDAIRGALRPGGRVVVELPNMANLFTGTYLRYADRTHEWGYTEQSLRQLLEAAGFADVHCFEERIPAAGAKGLAANAFRALARFANRVIYRGYELPVPTVLTPSLCATAVRPAEGP